MTRSPRAIPALALLISASGCADAIGRAAEDTVRASVEGARELGRTRPAALLAAGELRCDGAAQACETHEGATLGCHAQSERLSAQLGEELAPCVDACGDLAACFDHALATVTAGTSPSAESERCSARLAGCALTSDACGALDVLTDEPLRTAVIACADVPCKDLQSCLRDALLPAHDTAS